ncbi:MAG: type VII toxin-antitoxin system MntA family adenylyltransferase antitoxin [Caulobacteraceae bacterium]
MAVYNYGKTIEEIADLYNVDLFVYFGSFKTEYYNSESDIDIAFLSPEQLTAETKLQLLEELIKYHRKSEIDLVDLRTADPLLRYEIARNGKILYERHDGLFDRYSLYYFKRFYELKPVFEQEMEKLKADIKEVLGNA